MDLIFKQVELLHNQIDQIEFFDSDNERSKEKKSDSIIQFTINANRFFKNKTDVLVQNYIYTNFVSMYHMSRLINSVFYNVSFRVKNSSLSKAQANELKRLLTDNVYSKVMNFYEVIVPTIIMQIEAMRSKYISEGFDPALYLLTIDQAHKNVIRRHWEKNSILNKAPWVELIYEGKKSDLR